jgi:hypothetical protein
MLFVMLGCFVGARVMRGSQGEQADGKAGCQRHRMAKQGGRSTRHG